MRNLRTIHIYIRLFKKMHKHLIYIIVLFSVISTNIQSQVKLADDIGFTAGLTFNFGTKVNRIGLQASAYYVKSIVQLNTGLRAYYSFNSYGPKGNRPEVMYTLGALIAYGEKDTFDNQFIHPLSNQTRHRYGVGYSYNFYWDKIGTTQQSGTIAFHFPNTEIIFENDMFIPAWSDEFRTGAFQVTYYYKQETRVSVNLLTWTGAFRHPNRKTVKDTDYPSRFGYFDIKDCPYGNLSHGILGLQVQHMLPYRQVASAMMGIDSERIRHAIQNRFIHDGLFLPVKRRVVPNPHFPMIDKEGNPFLFKEGQEVRPAKFFLDLGFNPYVTY